MRKVEPSKMIAKCQRLKGKPETKSRSDIDETMYQSNRRNLGVNKWFSNPDLDDDGPVTVPVASYFWTAFVVETYPIDKDVLNTKIQKHVEENPGLNNAEIRNFKAVTVAKMREECQPKQSYTDIFFDEEYTYVFSRSAGVVPSEVKTEYDLPPKSMQRMSKVVLAEAMYEAGFDVPKLVNPDHHPRAIRAKKHVDLQEFDMVPFNLTIVIDGVKRVVFKGMPTDVYDQIAALHPLDIKTSVKRVMLTVPLAEEGDGMIEIDHSGRTFVVSRPRIKQKSYSTLSVRNESAFEEEVELTIEHYNTVFDRALSVFYLNGEMEEIINNVFDSVYK